ncbi:Signal transduction histidine kinase [Duganella sp. CF402]|uniref:hybrid sensor histidine kinase/response regulator n=1 Tax=unclassified Duganella TaxID=2636909 RepID=UPI0008D4C8C8|nr:MULTISPECIES: ATP-binding protein [unclassified Duganella]RZT10636.1 signal transduction histidine kinase [Duganella sp. BK701]SEL04853.1 Signal transduction histidine kinase [Duganella sp. CF402]
MAFLLFQLNSLRSRLVLLVLLAIAPITVMTLINGQRERDHAVETAQENLQRLTNLAAANEAQLIAGARQMLRDMAGVPGITGDAAECTRLMANLLRQNPDYSNLGLIQLNGDVSCSAVPFSTPVNLADRSHFRRAVHLRRFVAGGYVFGRVIQKHTVNLTYPVLDDEQRVKAVVFASLDLSRLDRFVADIQLPPDSLLLTADSEGKIISRKPDPDNWYGKQVAPEMRNAMAAEPGKPVLLTGPDGVERLHRFARVGNNGLTDYTVTIGIPVEQITANARHDQMLDWAALAATIGLALAAAWFVGDVLVLRRVKRLANTANSIASGALDARTGISYGKEEISELAHALDAMAAALQDKERQHQRAENQLREADRRKDEFLAMLAHELRNPLAPISAGAQLLQAGHASEPVVQRTAAIIVRQVHHMTRLVDDLLDVSRVTRGLVTLARAPLDARDIVADAVEQAEPLMKARQHHFEVALPPFALMVTGDHKRLVQVLVNVLNNAAKYTPSGGIIKLAARFSGDHVVLVVSDNGIGMSAELRSHVFDLFAQAERHADRSQGGLGLGLALVKSLVELHGGSVAADSAGEQKGSTFTITLPATRQAAPPTQPGQPATPSHQLRVLVVDDNVDAAQTLQLLLETAGHRVITAHSAVDALEAAQAHAPQLCLLDIGLPGISGYELVRALRSLPATAGATMVAITGYGRREDREQARAAGFDEYFVKPVDVDALLALIAGLPLTSGAP